MTLISVGFCRHLASLSKRQVPDVLKRPSPSVRSLSHLLAAIIRRPGFPSICLGGKGQRGQLTPAWPCKHKDYPEGPSPQYLRTLVPNTIKGMVSGTRVLEYCVLGPSGLVISAGPTRHHSWSPCRISLTSSLGSPNSLCAPHDPDSGRIQKIEPPILDSNTPMM